MVKLWICLALIASISCNGYASSRDQEDLYDDYYLNDMEQDMYKPVSDIFKTTLPDLFKILDSDKEVNEEPFEMINYEDEKDIENEGQFVQNNYFSKADGDLDDYQFEDNRSEVDVGSSNESEDGVLIRPLSGMISPEDAKEENVDKSIELPIGLPKVYEDADKTILEETKSILDEDTINEFDNDKTFEKNQVNDDNSNIFEETSKILEESYSEENTDRDYNNGGEEINSVSESVEDSVEKINTSTVVKYTTEEDTVDKAYTDLMSDLDKLHRTWKKLNDFNENSNDFGSDKKKQKIASSDHYEEIDDEELAKIFENDSDVKNNADKIVSSDENLSEIFENDSDVKNNEDKIVSSDESLSEIFENDSDVKNNEDKMVSSDENLSEIFENVSDVKNNEDKIVSSDENLSMTSDVSPSPAKTYSVLPYLNDALVASDVETNLPTSTVSSANEVNIKETSTPVQDQTSSVEDNLMKQFIEEHQSVYNIKASDVRNAINVRLTIDNPVEVTSPDYPLPYPTNTTVDWMFTGDGMGIELNITDFSINGHLGDYLLVKPGGVDESGSTGILFTYNLRTERRYRFLDVDKMFVRFFANPGNQFMRGFKFSARMVVPRPGGLVEPEPEPEPSLPEPSATITVFLGGVTLQNFLQIEEQFRQIVADMATLYINTHGIDPGVNTTFESTQIISRVLCYHNWPKFELCTEVQFGVPLVYGEKNDTIEDRLNRDDLLDMWTFYSQRDPFAVRLRQLGITEYQVPDDASVLSLWLVVAGGVVVSAALLALALWRFSCFEDYTRMPLYSDTDSIAEKRTLDLYPTPHQTLPPLYTETDYKWAHDNFDTDKVDMGFPNKSFLPDDEFEAPGGAPRRDGNFSFSPRDVYNV